jgi:DNA-binding HxlR family transcriptional regulator
MPTTRTYADACPIARALDVIGERWALVVVRELLLGGQRFSDLRQALPGASSNMLTDRLRELERHGVVHRRRLAPPAASWVYELTGRGRALEPVVDALGAWGSAEVAGETAWLSATSVLLFLRGSARAHPDRPRGTYRLGLDDRVWTLASGAAGLEIEPGEPSAPDAAIDTDPRTLNALLTGHVTLEAAIGDGSVQIDGDLAALRALLSVTADRPASHVVLTSR